MHRPAPAAPVVHRSEDRGRTRIAWLDSRHSFSFADWYDSARMGVGPLRVLNDDVVAPGAGFGAHPHRDMEIVSYVLEGGLAHRDSHGHEGVVRAGEVQFMRAGTGVVHSEMNASATERVRFLQVWILPRRRGLAPAYDQRRLDLRDDGRWAPIAGPGGFDLDADARMLAARVPPGGAARHPVAPGRAGYLYVVDGAATVAGHDVRKGDAVALPEGAHEAATREGAHLLLLDLGLG